MLCERLLCLPHCAPRYYVIIVQYSARLDFEKVKKFLHRMNGEAICVCVCVCVCLCVCRCVLTRARVCV